MIDSSGDFQAADHKINERQGRERQEKVCADGEDHNINADDKNGAQTVKHDFFYGFSGEKIGMAWVRGKESLSVKAQKVPEEIKDARRVKTQEKQRSGYSAAQYQMESISDGKHGTYIIAHSKKALAFFFCAGTGENLIADDFGSERVSAEKAEDQCIGEISVKIREFSVDGIKNHGNQMQRLIFIHQTCEKKKRKQSGNDGSGPENQSFPCTFHTDFREKEQKAGKK